MKEEGSRISLQAVGEREIDSADDQGLHLAVTHRELFGFPYIPFGKGAVSVASTSGTE